MTVRKETGRGTGRRRQSGSEETPRRKSKCAKCGEQPGHPNHPGVHEFEERARKAKAAPKATGPYRVVSTDLPESDKFKEGNRFHRVFLALQALPDSTGTLEEVIVAVVTDGARAMTNPEKIIRRALKQLMDFGTVTQGEQTANTEPEATSDQGDD